MLHFIFLKNVKMGIKYSITVPDTPQKTNNAIGFQWHCFFISELNYDS
jgi:hypothetical protein